MEILQSLGIDQSVLVHLIVFLVVFAILSQFLFKPMADYLERRKKVTDGGLEGLKVLEKEYEIRTQAQKQRERSFEKELGDRYSKELNLHREKLKEKIDLVKDQNQVTYAEQIAKVQKESQELKGQMESHALEITDLIYAKVTQ